MLWNFFDFVDMGRGQAYPMSLGRWLIFLKKKEDKRVSSNKITNKYINGSFLFLKEKEITITTQIAIIREKN